MDMSSVSACGRDPSVLKQCVLVEQRHSTWGRSVLQVRRSQVKPETKHYGMQMELNFVRNLPSPMSGTDKWSRCRNFLSFSLFFFYNGFFGTNRYGSNLLPVRCVVFGRVIWPTFPEKYPAYYSSSWAKAKSFGTHSCGKFSGNTNILLRAFAIPTLLCQSEALPMGCTVDSREKF